MQGQAPANVSAIGIGAAATAKLVPTASFSPAAIPGKPAAAASHGGLFAFTVATSGRYQVALGAAAWLDVIRDGAVLASLGHGHGPACTGIRKIVQFDLKPGRCLLQIAGSPVASVPVLVASAG